MRSSKTKITIFWSAFAGLVILLVPAILFFSLSKWSGQAFTGNNKLRRPTLSQKSRLISDHKKTELKPSTDSGSEKIITVESGIALKTLAKKLLDAGYLDSDKKFYYWVRFTQKFPDFQAGRYLFHHPVSPQQIVASMISGSTYSVVTLDLTVPEGFTLEQINKRLARLKVAPYHELNKLSHNQTFIKQLGINSPNLEGFLYPASYRFYDKFPEPETVFRKMSAEFFKRLPEDYIKKAKEHQLSLRDAVTFASLIEKETQLESERALVSEVIWNRLKKKMPLGIDASLIYGIENYQGNITFTHLKDKKNLYNGRIHRGLPPGPIGAPGRESLAAVFNPSKKGFYYYVLLPGGAAKHHFSSSLKEHNRYVKKLVDSYKNERKSRIHRKPKIQE